MESTTLTDLIDRFEATTKQMTKILPTMNMLGDHPNVAATLVFKSLEGPRISALSDNVDAAARLLPSIKSQFEERVMNVTREQERLGEEKQAVERLKETLTTEKAKLEEATATLAKDRQMYEQDRQDLIKIKSQIADIAQYSETAHAFQNDLATSTI